MLFRYRCASRRERGPRGTRVNIGLVEQLRRTPPLRLQHLGDLDIDTYCEYDDDNYEHAYENDNKYYEGPPPESHLTFCVQRFEGQLVLEALCLEVWEELIICWKRFGYVRANA